MEGICVKTKVTAISEHCYKQIMKDYTALYLNKSNVLLHGEKSYISEDRTVTPLLYKNEIIIPIKFFAKSMGGEFKQGDRISSICYKHSKLNLNSEENAFVDERGVWFASAKLLCNAFDIYLHIEENGIIIYGTEDANDIFDWHKNMRLMRKICESYMFDDVSGDEILDAIKKNHSNCKHPRLILTSKKIEKMRTLLEKHDKVYDKMFENIKTYADRYLEEKSSGYELRDDIRLLYVCRENGCRMLVCALMYLLTQDEKYAQRAYMDMYVCACFVDWNPYHFLDVGEMSMSMGICYDWLYTWMNETQRRIIRESIVKNGINPIIDDFDDKPRKRSWNWRGDLADNWRFVITGICVGAMAIMDELDGVDLVNAKRAAEQTLFDIRRALSLFSPLGAYEEGFNYWGYTMEYFAYLITALETVTGSDYGYTDIPGMSLTNNFMVAVNGSVSVFSYHDSGRPGTDFPPQMMFLAKRFNKLYEAKPRINKVMYGMLPDANDTVADMIFYDENISDINNSTGELDVYMPISELVTMRSGWKSEDMFVGFHCDNPMGDGTGHSHMDAGEFVLDALGENFFFDLGADNYNLPDYVNTYRVRAEGHNVLVINPGKGYGQRWNGTARIIKHEFCENGGFAVGDLSDAYEKESHVESYKRIVIFDRIHKKVVLKDDLTLTEKGEIYWFNHTEADIKILDGGKKALLIKNGKKLYARIIEGESALFEIMEPVPLKTSPVVEGQNKNIGIHKLSIHIKNIDRLNLSVEFSVNE